MLRLLYVGTYLGLLTALSCDLAIRAQQAVAGRVTIPDGTPVHLYLKDDVSSKGNKANDVLHFQVKQDVKIGSVVVISAGTSAVGHVLKTKRNGFAGHAGSVSISVDSVIAADGTSIHLRSMANLGGGDSTAEAEAALALYGPLGLLVRGTDANIPSGTALTAYVNGDSSVAAHQPADALDIKPPQSAVSTIKVQPQGLPAISILEPLVRAGQVATVNSSTLVVKGLVSSSSSSTIELVTINSLSAITKKSNTHEASFWSDPIALKPGDNAIEIEAVNSEGAHAAFKFVARFNATPPTNSKAISKQEILTLLSNSVPSSTVAGLVRKYGVKFTPTSDDLDQIRKAGGGNDLVDAINSVSVSK